MNRPIAIVLAGVLCACTAPSASRAERDRDVGQAEESGVRVSVTDGLAAVLHLDAERLRLWCSAPEIAFTIQSDDERAMAIELWNAMPDAAVFATGADGAAMSVALEDTSVVTRKRLEVELSAGESTFIVRTPDTGDRGPWRFALMSDVQNGIDEVQDVFSGINAAQTRFLLGAGDLAQFGTREELERFRRELEQLTVPYYTTLGNHDAPETGLWQELYGRGNFRFAFRGVQFTMLDSASATVDPMAYEWLDEWLFEGLSRVNVFAMHIPALDPVGTRNGAFGSRNEAGKLLSALHKGNVALTLYGHIHSFYQFDNGGIPAFISGGGGAFEEKGDGYGRHFMVIEVGADAGVLSTEMIEVPD
jgi:hypothetical protein